MNKRSKASTSALLQKVSTQLKGERVATVPKEEDELTAYLNSLSKKTSQQTKAVNFSDFGDISISSSDNISTPKQKSPKIGAGSKFLKKKIVEEPEEAREPIKSQPRSQINRKSTGSQNTSALLKKTTGLTNKSTSVHQSSSLLTNQNVFSIDTDTEDSESYKVARFSRVGSSSEQSIGHDGKRFMQRPETPKATVGTSKQEKKKSFKKEKSKKVAILTSEEDSLADFMQRLSSSDSTPKPRAVKYHQRPADGAPPKARSPSPDSKPYRMTPSPRSPRKTPSPLVGRRTPSPLHRSQDSDMIDSLVSEVVDTHSSDDMFKVVMDIDALEPALPEPSKPQKSKSLTKKISFKKEKDKPRKEKKSKESDIFSSFGLQSVEDLMGRISDDDSIASEVSEVRIERSNSITRIPRKDSLSEIKTFGGDLSSNKRVSLGKDYEDSISERIGMSSKRSSIVSEVLTQYSEEDSVGEYTEGFESEVDSVTDTRSINPRKSKLKSLQFEDEKSFSESYTSYSDSKTYSKSVSRPVSPRKHRTSTRSVQVQTGEEPGLTYSWRTPIATLAPQYGLDFVDPSPIATHVINADALEAMTAYNPAMIALHDMLRQQLLLTRSFLSAQQRIYNNMNSTVESNYKYTTLEDTKEYIKKHRKKPITFKEAYRMVSAEMDS